MPLLEIEVTLFAYGARCAHRITVLLALASGKAEEFMRRLGRMTTISVVGRKTWKEETLMGLFLCNFRATTSHATMVASNFQTTHLHLAFRTFPPPPNSG